MGKTLKIGLLLFAVICLLLAYPAWEFYAEIQRAASDDPLVWEPVIDEFDAQREAAPKNAVVFTGSSSIRLWSNLAEDVAPIPVVQRGFGGAKLNDVAHYAERLVNHYHPRAVVIFAGTNDIDPRASKTPQNLLQSYQQFVAKVRADQPTVPIYYIAITPSISRWEVWPLAQQTNELINNWSAQNSGLYVIDTGPALLDAYGKPDPDNYRWDKLHLSKQGYAIWAKLIRKRLLSDFPDWAAASGPG